MFNNFIIINTVTFRTTCKIIDIVEDRRLNLDQFNYILDNIEKNYPNISSYIKHLLKLLEKINPI